MNRALLKQDAKDAMRAANPHPVLVTLVYLAITMAASIVTSIVSAITGVTSGVFMSGVSVSSADQGASVSFVTALIVLVVSLALTLVMSAIQFGYYVYSLKVFKHEETGIAELWGHFPRMLKIFGLMLWIGLFTWLWSLLCFIPGIIAALRYSQAFYIMAEDPDKGIRECVNESKLLMSGRLWEYFVLVLSFILWFLLASITCGIATLYVTPYVSVTMAGYYLSLKPADPAASAE